MPMDEEHWKFKHGVEEYSERLKTEVLGVAQWIQEGKALDEDQLELIKSVFQSLYENNQVKIKQKKGRPSGTITPNLEVYSYMVILLIDEEDMKVGKAKNKIAKEYGLGTKTLEAAYDEHKNNIRHLLKTDKNYRRIMDFVVNPHFLIQF